MSKKLFKSLEVKIGNRFGRLTVIGFTDTKHINKHGYNQLRRFAKCQCDCGSNPVLVRLDGLTKPDNLSRKPSRSCGCLQREATTKHGLWKHPLYKIWRSMMERCHHPITNCYDRYGGRGIRVCEEWQDVHVFIADMQQGYQKGLQIDRIDNSKGYFKENCRWVTRLEQANNKLSNILITFNGKTQTIKQWSRELHIVYGTLVNRIQNYGWSIEKALTQPVRKGSYRRKP